MTYLYSCSSCRREFDVVKAVADIDRPETCENCGAEAKRDFVPRISHFIGTAVQHIEYNPGLGCLVRNSQHRKEICRARNLEELGNEKVENIHKHYEKAREEKRERSWAEFDGPGWIGNGESAEINTKTSDGET